MKTCLQIHNDIEAMLPSCTEFGFDRRSAWIDDVMLRVYRDVGVMKTADILLTTTVKQYDVTSASTQVEIMNIGKIYVTANKTTCSTDIAADAEFIEYQLNELLDVSMPNYITFDNYFDEERMLRFQYLAIPALFPSTSSDSTSTPDIDPEAVNAIEYGAIVRMCKAGSAPDVQLANAYEADYREEMRRLKAMVRIRNRKTLSPPINYKEMW